MPAGLSIAIALLAQVAGAEPAAPAYGPAPQEAAKPRPKPPVTKTAEGCRTAPPSADPSEILVCVERPQGYRLNPDVMAAKRQSRGGRPTRSTAHMRDNNCASVGPMGCTGSAGINLIGVALTAVQMAARVARGESVAGMVVTTPEMSEYERYVAAKRQREAGEAQATAMAAAKAKAAAAAAPKP